MANFPLMFAEFLGGAILVDRGVKGLKTALETQPTSSSATSTGVVGTTGIGGTATGRAGAEAMLAAANAAVAAHIQYSTNVQSSGLLAGFRSDCSGFVSWVINHADPSFGDQTTVTIPSQPNVQPGPGAYVTLWNIPQPGQSGHVIIDILGNWFESGGQIGNGVVSMSASQVAQELGPISGNQSANGFSALHLSGM